MPEDTLIQEIPSDEPDFDGWERCVLSLKKSKSKQSAFAICTASYKKTHKKVNGKWVRKNDTEALSAVEIANLIEKAILIKDKGGNPDIIEKIAKSVVNYQASQSDNARCDLCRYWRQESCAIVAGDIEANWTCDAYNPTELRADYKVVDAERFVRGLVERQPLQTRVRGGLVTPEGVVILLEDEMGFRFGLPLQVFINLTASLHGWENLTSATIEQNGSKASESGGESSDGESITTATFPVILGPSKHKKLLGTFGKKRSNRNG